RPLLPNCGSDCTRAEDRGHSSCRLQRRTACWPNSLPSAYSRAWRPRYEMAARLGTSRTETVFPDVSSYILWSAIERRFPMKALQVHRVAAIERSHGRPCDHCQVHAISTLRAQLTGIQC